MLLGQSVIIDVMQLLGTILTAGLFTAVSAQQQPILDKQSVPIGGQFTVTCAANSFPPGTIPPEVYYIQDLSIERDVAVGPRKQIAVYNPLAPPPFTNISQFIPTGRKWIFVASGGLGPGDPPTHNRETIKIVLTVKDPHCSDAGIYRCNATYFPPNAHPVHIDHSQNLDGACSTGTRLEITDSPRFVRNMFLVDVAMFLWTRFL